MSSLKRVFDNNKAQQDWTCKYVVMPSNQGEGNARKLGIEKCTGDYFFLMDCDDVFGPDVVNRCYEIITNEKDKNISFIEFPFTSFDVRHTMVIEPYSIWVQSKCYNKKFITEHNIYSTDLSSRAGADYNFISKLHSVSDYYDRQESNEWNRIIANKEEGFTWSYWFPSKSQTRECDYWGSWICPKTVLNGLDAINFARKFEEDRKEENRREFWKMDILNKSCYNFINLHALLRDLTINEKFAERVTSIDSVSGEDNNVVFYDLFKRAFIETSQLCREYIDEIWDMDIWTMFSNVWNHSDAHKCQPWFDFREWVNKAESMEIFNFKDMKQLVKYCKENYEFDAYGFPLHAEQYKTFINRVSINNEDEKSV